MKRIISLFIALAITAAMCVCAYAASQKPSGSSKCEIEFTIKKADPNKVKKDGIIGEDEYDRLTVNTNPDNTPLWIVWGGSAQPDAYKILESVEYYFSWDEVHGLNIAVKYHPVNITQQISLKKGRIPEDGIMNNCALGVALNTKQRSNSVMDIFYYTIAKSTVEEGKYLVGYWNEQGLSKKYRPTGGEDFRIDYFEDGYVLYEWSIPLNEVYKDTSNMDGTKLCISVTAMGGDSKSDDFESCYGVALGDRGYLVRQNDKSEHAVAYFSDVPVGELFKDVRKSDYFYEGVKWAAKNAVTTGTSASEFSPNNDCTRGQIVTFLYRAAGSPTVAAKANIFRDIKSSDYFYYAVLWAAANGITSGTDDTHFSPNKTCTRGEALTFLHRFNNTPAASKKADFTDVKSGAFYYDAVNWGVENGITNGMTSDTFAPNKTCTRGQIVTFLFRADKQ